MEQGAIYIREFAYRVFLLAEKQESSQETLKKAVQSYLAALNFLQVYRGVFLEDSSALQLTDEELQDELNQVDEKSKYAKWRIIEIRKQLMLNSTLSPSNQQKGSEDIKSTHSTSSDRSDSKSPIIDANTYNSNTCTSNNTSSTPQIINSIPIQSLNSSSSPVLLYDPKVLSECERHARHAISALNFDDIETAAHNLQTALDLLKPLLNKQDL